MKMKMAYKWFGLNKRDSKVLHVSSKLITKLTLHEYFRETSTIYKECRGCLSSPEHKLIQYIKQC